MARHSDNQHGLSKLVIILIFGFLALVIGGIVLIVINSRGTVTPTPVSLTVWGVWDDSSDIAPIISAYQKSHPYISIHYAKKRYEEFAELLLNGWATDSGPDIYAIPNSWITKYKSDFIAVAPKTSRVAYYTTEKVLFRTETKINYQTDAFYTASDIRRNFVDVVYGDILLSGKIYGLPLGVNTLVMYYNRELLNQASLVAPPGTWADFASAVTRLTVVDDQNQILRAGTAMGTYDNVPNATDIVTLLMLQNGGAMTTGSKVTFHQAAAGEGGYYPGAEALRFYTDFATPEKSTYTWNDQMPNALDLFTQGKVAFFFGYPFQDADIRAKARGLDYDIAPVPQISAQNTVNLADYWVYTVAAKSQHPNEAWNFLQFASTAKNVRQYLTSTKQTSAVRSVLDEQLKKADTATLAQQALTAKSWYHGRDPESVETAFAEMIADVIGGEADARQAVTNAVKKIQQNY